MLIVWLIVPGTDTALTASAAPATALEHAASG